MFESLKGFYHGKSVLVTGADAPLARVVVRQILSVIYTDISRLYLLVDGEDIPAGSDEGGALLASYAKHRILAPLGDTALDVLQQRTEAIRGNAASNSDLGMAPPIAARLRGRVDVVIHGPSLLDPCSPDLDLSVVARGAHHAFAFAGRGAFVLASSLYSSVRQLRPAHPFASPEADEVAQQGMHFDLDSLWPRLVSGKGAPLDLAAETGIPLEAIALQAVIEAHLSSLAAKGGDRAHLCVVRHGLIGPPAVDPPDCDLLGGIDALALAVGTGHCRLLSLDAGCILDTIPADFLADRLITSPIVSARPVGVLRASTSSSHPVAARMMGRYFVEYFERNHLALAFALDYAPPAGSPYAKPIRVSLSSILTPCPSLSVSRNPPQRWGAVLLGGKGNTPHHLKRHPHTGAAARLRGTLELMGKLVGNLQSRPLSAGKVFEGAPLAVPDGWDIREVEWEMYCKNTARTAFLHLCCVLGISATSVPLPLKYCDMDPLVRKPGISLTRPRSVWQRALPDLHFLRTCSRQSTGQTIQYSPGYTPQRAQVILSLPSVRAAITEQAKKERVEEESVTARAVAVLDRIGDRLNSSKLKILGLALRKVMQTLYKHIHTNPDAYELLRRAFLGIGSSRPTGRRAVILIPTHRSYMDFLVASYLMYMWGLPVPHICSGEDFLRLAGVSTLLRGSGAFFMRRSFKGDQLYATLFREYVQLLESDGRLIEFFIEGTRSRSGKTLTPKLGILKMVVEAFLDNVRTGRDPEFVDVVFVPVSVSYDKVLEGNIYLRELNGHKKPPETLGNLLSSWKILQNRFGTLNVTVGTPISLSDFIDHGIDAVPPVGAQPLPSIPRPVGLLTAPPSSSSPPPPKGKESTLADKVADMDEKLMLNRLAWRITHDLQAGLIVTPTALLAAVAVYMHQPSEMVEGVNNGIILSEVVWLREQVLRWGGHMLPSLVRQTAEEMCYYAAEVLDPHIVITNLNRFTMPSRDSTLLMTVYSNQLVHLFASPAVLVAAVLSLADGHTASFRTKDSDFNEIDARAVRAPASLVRQRCDFLYDLLGAEFPDFSPSSPIPRDEWFSRTVSSAISNAAAVPTDPSHVMVPVDSPMSIFLGGIVHTVLEVYWFIGAAALVLLTATLREATFMERVGVATEVLMKAGVLQHETSRNRDVMKNALQHLKEIGAVDIRSTQSLLLTADYGANGGEKLREYVSKVNGAMWKPHLNHAAALRHVADAMALAPTEAKL